MRIEPIGAVSILPTSAEPAKVFDVPENTSAVVFRVLTKDFTSPRHGCTANPDLWFPCPAPIVFRQVAGRLGMCIVISREVIDPPATVEDFTVEFGVVRQSGVA